MEGWREGEKERDTYKEYIASAIRNTNMGWTREENDQKERVENEGRERWSLRKQYPASCARSSSVQRATSSARAAGTDQSYASAQSAGTALHCTALYSLHCNVLPLPNFTAVYFNLLHSTALYCTSLPCIYCTAMY